MGAGFQVIDLIMQENKKRFVKGDIVKVQIARPLPQGFDYMVGDEEVNIGAVVDVPFGAKTAYGVVWAEGTGRGRELREIGALRELPEMRAPMRSFLEAMSRYTLAPIGQILPMALRVPPPLKNPPQMIEAVPGFDLAPIKNRAKKQAELYEWLLENGPVLAKDTGYSRAVINGLEANGGARFVDENDAQMPSHNHPQALPKPRLERLSAAQRAALEAVLESKKPVLLKGVTGAGKTEVYLEYMAKIISEGAQALLLLPEIALSTGFVARARDRLGIEIGHWHSQMGQEARRRIWHDTASGRLKLVIGARSALFLPFANLGLITVDEEHDAAYKQEEGVIYHGRDMAVLRASIEGAGVLLASATPSLESMQNVASGKYALVEIGERYGDATLPEIRAIDMREAKLDAAHFVSEEIVNEVAARMGRGEQSLLFLNRRGFAPATICRACGHQIGCPNCDARLVEHRARARLLCHQCGLSRRIPNACPGCKTEGKLVASGPGVERLAEEVKTLFPKARISIISSDLISGEGEYSTLMQAIAGGEFDIIIGTQLIAKGHHFPLLTLVAIIDADSGLEGGDIRASERSFQLIRQVAGRAGREKRAGLVLVQSYQPDHPILQAMLKTDDEEFYQGEIARRLAASAPPFSRYVGIIIRAPELDDAMGAGRRLAKALEGALKAHRAQIFGPATAPIARIRGRFRVRILVKLPRALAPLDALHACAESVKTPSNIRIALDVDPQSFF